MQDLYAKDLRFYINGYGTNAPTNPHKSLENKNIHAGIPLRITGVFYVYTTGKRVLPCDIAYRETLDIVPRFPVIAL